MTRTYDSSAGAVPDSGDSILTGVAAIQFVIRANGNGTLYHEWDVTGSATITAVPEPGSLLALDCLLGSGVCLRSRRR